MKDQIPLKKIFAILLIPLAEIIFLRQQINIRFSFPMTEAVLLFFAGLWIYLETLGSKKMLASLSLNLPAVAINLVALGLFFALSQNQPGFFSQWGETTFWGAWYGLGAATLLSSFCVLLTPGRIIQMIRRSPYEFLFFSLGCIPFVLYGFSLKYLWSYLSLPTTYIVNQILILSGLEMLSAPDVFSLKHPLFQAYIGSPCSGLEGISFFIAIFSMIMIKDYRLYAPLKILFFYAAGIVYMFVLNIVRITVFFMASLYAIERVGKEQATTLFVWFFHSHIGWVLYAVGILVFLMILFAADKKAGRAHPSPGP